MTDNALEKIYQDVDNDSATKDFDTARVNTLALIDEGTAALRQLIMVADQSQNPRAYEVVARMMDSILMANRQLLEMQGKIRDIQQADSGVTSGRQTINNNLFLSTSDMQKLILGIKNDGTT